MTRQHSAASTPTARRAFRGPAGPRHALIAGAALLAAACTNPPPLPVAAIAVAGASAATDGGQSEFTVPTGKSVQLDGGGSKSAAGEQLTFLWSFVKLPTGSVTGFDRPAAPAPRFVPDVPGTYVVQLVVRGDIMESLPVQVSIAATTCGAHAPVAGALTATPNAPGVGQAVQLAAPALADEDNAAACGLQQTFTHAWTIVGQPTGSRAQLNDPAALKPTFVPDQAGAWAVQLVVTDSTGLASAPSVLTLTAGACGGNAPVIASVASSVVQPGVGTTLVLTADVSDADLIAPCSLKQALTYRWAVVAQPRGSLARLNDPALVSPSFTPDVGGAYTFRAAVTDSTGRAAQPKDLTVTASACGSAVPQPAILAPVSASIGQAVQLSSTVRDEDITACSLSQSFDYFWALKAAPTGSAAALNAPRAVNPSFTPDVAGPYLIELRVIDSGGVASEVVSTTVLASTCGSAVPSVDDLVASPASPSSGQQVRVTPLVSDPDSACADYDPTRVFEWTLATRPPGSGAYVRDPSAQVAVFTADLPGSYQLSLRVRDAHGRWSQARLLNLTAGACGLAAPSLANARASAAQPDPGTPVALSVDVSDADADPPCSLAQAWSLRWSVISRPAGSGAQLSNPGAAQPVFVPDLPGAYQFQVSATDTAGLRSAPAFVTITASSCGTRAPSVTATPDAFTTQPGQAVQLGAIPSDPDALCGVSPSFSYAWTVSAAPAGSNAVVSDPGSASPTFAPDLEGDYQLQVVATDGAGLSSPPAFVRISATGCASLPPVVQAIAVAGGALGSAATLSAVGVRDDNCAAAGGALSWSWTLEQRPLGSAAVLTAPAATSTRLVPDVAGSYLASLVVKSASGLSSRPVYATLAVASCGGSQFTWDPSAPVSASSTEPDGSPIAGLPHVGSTVSLRTAFTDANPTCSSVPVTPFTWRWALVSRPRGSAARLSSADEAQPSFVPDVQGDYQLAVTVADALGTLSPIRFLTVKTDTCGAIPPVATLAAPATSTPLAGEVVALSAAASSTPDAACPARLRDPSTPRLVWSVREAPAGAATPLAAAEGGANAFTGTVAGRYVVAVTPVSPAGLAGAALTATFDVAACGGRAPSVVRARTLVGGVPSARPAVNQPVTVSVDAVDPDAACSTPDAVAGYSFRALSLPAGSALQLDGALQASPDLVFAPDVAGSYVLSVTAVDSTGLRSAPFAVAVQTGACAPTFAGITGSPSAVAGVSSPLSLPAVSDTCVADPQLSTQWSLLDAPAGSLAGFSTPRAASTGFTPDRPGRYLVQAVVTDQGGFSSAPATLSILAGTCGTLPPVLGGGHTAGTPILTSKAVPDPGDLVALSVPDVSNPNAGCSAQFAPLSYRWTLVSQPAGSHGSLAPARSDTPALAVDLGGTYLVSVAVTDAMGNESDAAFLALQATDCGRTAPTPPSITVSAPGGAPLSRPPVGAPVRLTATSVDPDAVAGGACGASPRAQTLSYRWSVVSTPAGSLVSATTSTAAVFDFTPDRAGTYTFAALAVDSTGLQSAAASVAVPTGACGPTLAGLTASTLSPAVGASVALGTNPDPVTDACVGPGPLSYAWSLAARPAASSASLFASGTGTSFAPDVPGGYQVRLVVTDAAGFASAATANLTATACTAEPTIGALSWTPAAPGASTPHAGNPDRGDLVTFSASGVAAGACGGAPSGAFAYLWSITSGPVGSTARFSDPTAPEAAFLADVAGGTWQVALVVTDSRGNVSAPALATVTASTCGGRAPVASLASPALPIAIDAGAQVALTAAAADQNAGCPARLVSTGFTWAWSVVAQPSGGAAAFGSPAAAATTFTAAQPGGYALQAVATDSFGNRSAPLAVPLTVNACGGRPPAIAALSATQTRYDGATRTATGASTLLDANVAVDLAAAVSDPDADAACGAAGPIALRWRLLRAPAGSGAALDRPDAANPRFLPDLPGPYAVELIATDETGRSASAVLDLTVDSCGATGPSVADAGPSAAIAASQTLPGPLALSSTTLETSPSHLAVRTPIRLAANVVDPNASCGMTPQNRLAWTLAAPAGSRARLDDAGADAPGFTPDVAGAYTVTARATSALGLSGAAATLTFVADCNSNAPQAVDAGSPAFAAAQSISGLNTSPPAGDPLPIVHSTLANASNLRFYPGHPVALAANVADADSGTAGGQCGIPQSISYSWSFERLPAGSAAAFDDATSATPRFTPDLPGTYALRLTLVDQSGNGSTQVFDASAGRPLVEVSDCGTRAPTGLVTVTGPNPGSPGAATTRAFFGDTVGFTATGSATPDAAPLDATAGTGCGLPLTLSYAWSFTALPGAAQPLAIAGATSLAGSFVPPVDGDYALRLVVSDGVHASAPAALSVHVATPNAAQSTFTATPVAALGGTPVADGVDRYDLLLTVRDAAGGPVDGLPVTFGATPVNATLSATSGTTDGLGQIALTLKTLVSRVGQTPDPKQVTATSATFSKQTVLLTFVPGPVTHLAWLVQPTNTAIGDPIGGAGGVKVAFLDANQNIAILGAPRAVTLTLTNTPTKHPPTLSGTVTASDPEVVTFTGLTLDRVATGLTLQADSAGSPTLAAATSDAFNSTSTNPPPDAPTGLAATPPSDKQIALTWTPVAGATSYDVLRDGTAITPASGTSTAFFTDAPLGDGETHSYTVVATNAIGQNSAPSAPLLASTMTAAPVLSATPQPDRVTLSWTLPAGAVTFDVQRATPTCADAFSTLAAGAGVTTTPFDDTTAAAATPYCYRVLSINGGGQRPSNDVAAQRAPPPPAPANLVGAPGDKRVDLSWDPVSATFLAGYHVLRDGAQIASVASSTVSYSDQDPALVNGTAYTYVVRAFDTGGQESADSNSIVRTPSGEALRVLTFAPTASPTVLRSQVKASRTFGWTLQGTPATLTFEPGGNSVLAVASTSSVPFPGGGAAVATLDPRGYAKVRGATASITLDKAELGGVSTAWPNVVVEGAAAFADGGVAWGGQLCPAGGTATIPGFVNWTGNQDLFVAKSNAAGTVQWVKPVGGATNSFVSSVAALGDGGLAAVGFYDEALTLGGTEPNQTALATSGLGNALVARYNGDGTLAWARQTLSGLGGLTSASSVAALPDGGLLVAGTLTGAAATSTFGPGELSATTLTVAAGTQLAWLARYSSSGSLLWARGVVAGQSAQVAALVDGGAALLGSFTGTQTFGGAGDPGTATVAASAPGAATDAFVARFSADGALQMVRGIGNVTAGTTPRALAALDDGSGFLASGFITATTTVGDPGGQVVLDPGSTSGAFVARYNVDGTVAWAKFLDGTEARSLSTWPDGSVAVVGDYAGSPTLGPSEPGQVTLPPAAVREILVGRLEAATGALSWLNTTTSTGGSQTAIAGGAAPGGDVWLGALVAGPITFGLGETGETVLAGTGAALARYHPVNQRFLRLRPTGLAWSKLEGGAGSDQVASLAAFRDGSVAAAGSFQGAVTLSSGEPNATTLTAASGDTGAFVARYGVDGKLAWARQAASALPSGVHRATAVSVLPNDRGIVAVGFHHATSTNPLDFGGGNTLAVPAGGAGQDFFAVGYSPTGTVAWVRGSTSFDLGGGGDVRALGVAALADGGAILTGPVLGLVTIGATPIDPGNALAATLVARLSPTGAVTWAIASQNTSSDNAETASPSAVAAFPNGSSVVLGLYSSTPTFGATTLSNTGSARFFLAKVTSGGAFGIVQRSASVTSPVVGGLTTLPDGSFVAGYTFGSANTNWSTNGDGSTQSSNVGGPSGALVRYDATDNLAWVKATGGDNAALSSLGDGTFVATGHFTSTSNVFGASGDPAGQVTLPMNGATAGLYVARYNLAGQLLWVRGETGGASSTSAGTAVAALPDSGVIVGASLNGQVTFGSGEANATTLAAPAGTDFSLARYFSYGPFTATAP